MNPYLEKFTLDCETKGMTKHSIETYQSNLLEFLTYYPKPQEVTTDQLRVYLGKLRSRNLANATLKGYMSAVSSFFDFLVFENEIKKNPTIEFRKRYLHRIKNHSESRQLITVQEMRDLYESARTIQEKALIMFMAKTGVRRGELHELKESDLDFDRKKVNIPQKAKRSNTIAFMDPELETTLKEYLAWRQKRTKSGWLWISSKGGRIHKDRYGMILAELGRELHLHRNDRALEAKLTPHCFRHWFTTNLFRSGMNSQYIKFRVRLNFFDLSFLSQNIFSIDSIIFLYLKI